MTMKKSEKRTRRPEQRRLTRSPIGEPPPPKRKQKKCPSGKFRYADEISAKIALANIQWKDSARRGKMEKRVYECPDCKGFHLTSRA